MQFTTSTFALLAAILGISSAAPAGPIAPASEGVPTCYTIPPQVMGQIQQDTPDTPATNSDGEGWFTLFQTKGPEGPTGRTQTYVSFPDVPADFVNTTTCYLNSRFPVNTTEYSSLAGGDTNKGTFPYNIYLADAIRSDENPTWNDLYSGGPILGVMEPYQSSVDNLVGLNTFEVGCDHTRFVFAAAGNIDYNFDIEVAKVIAAGGYQEEYGPFMTYGAGCHA